MKKNVMMRVAAMLLVCVLASTCGISGTFAKYVTTGSGSDFARVAKWGVEINAKNNALFTDMYETEVDANKGIFTGNFTVDSANGEDVVAPGTKGTVTDISITGTPEVAVEVKVESTVTLTDNWIVNGDFYCPLIITIGTTKICGLDYTGANAAENFAAAIKTAIDAYSAKYDPNKNLAEVADGTNLDISWEWAFDNAAHLIAHPSCDKQTDEKDTALGNLAVEADRRITIALVITVTQVD